MFMCTKYFRLCLCWKWNDCTSRILTRYGRSESFRQPLQWRHDGCNGVSNHQPHDCLLNRLFRHSSKKTSKLRLTGLCSGNSWVTGKFPAQMTSNAENVSIWWLLHENMKSLIWFIWLQINTSDIPATQCEVKWTASRTVVCRYNASKITRKYFSDIIMNAYLLFDQPFVQAQIKINIKAPRHWPLWGKLIVDRWIPRTKGQ